MATMIFKPTERCNSNCLYCYVVKKRNPKTMSYDLLEHVFININEYLKHEQQERFKILWHGGEPLLLGEEFFLQAIKFQEKHCSDTKHRIFHEIQSNLTLLNENFLKIFKEMGIKSIGTSFEPISNIRGPGTERNSEYYNKLFFKGINILEKNSFRWGFIYVVNKRSIGYHHELFNFLSNLKNAKSFSLNPIVIYGEDKDKIGISPQEYADFIGAIFTEWWKHRNRYPSIEPFTTYIDYFINKTTVRNCEESGRCNSTHVYIGPDGKASHCGRSGDWEIISYGNIKERSLIDIMQDEQRKRFVKRQTILAEGECKNCRFWDYCHGGCPLESYVKHKDFKHKSYKCEGKKIFLEKYFIPITGVRL